MGIKRPLEGENFPEASFKQLKQLDSSMNQTLNTEESQITWEVDSGGGGTDIADKDMEASAPVSLVTSSSSEEDCGDGNTSFLSYLPGHIDSNVTRQPPKQFEDPYVYLLNCSPRKEVPVGPDHQAVVSPWDPNGVRKEVSCSSYIAYHHREQKLMGTCIIQMPELSDSTIDRVEVGRGSIDCSCLDKVSMRCVQRHVKEARERLRETIGYKNFMELGFYEMGDEVACKWTSGEEQLFHEVVFSNPVSQGRNFWKALRAAFPTRTKRELVSYYFNVFMLHKRAVQNRSYMLEIDSDDDEEPNIVNGDVCLNASNLLEMDSDDDDEDDDVQLQVTYEDFHPNGSYLLGPASDIVENPQSLNSEFYLAGGEEDSSTVESLDDQDLDTSWVDDFWSEPENNSGDKGSSN